MLSLATSRSKKPSAQPPDPNIRLDFGETAARRSFCLRCMLQCMVRLLALNVTSLRRTIMSQLE